MGLEMGVNLFEKAVGLSTEGQRHLLDILKGHVSRQKAKALMEKRTYFKI